MEPLLVLPMDTACEGGDGMDGDWLLLRANIVLVVLVSSGSSNGSSSSGNRSGSDNNTTSSSRTSRTSHNLLK